MSIKLQKWCDAQQIEEAQARLEGLLEIENKYIELTAAVESKYPDETRHETALRYIKDRENSTITGYGEVKLTDANANNALINRNSLKI